MSDPARGTRRYRFDDAGRPREAVLADGRSLSFVHDEGGMLRGLRSDDGFILSIGSSRRDATFSVEDRSGRTDVLFERGGRLRRLGRGADVLAIELDGEERIRRVGIPGSAGPLVYEWKDDGGCEIGPSKGPWTVRLAAQGAFRSIELAPGVGWLEKIFPGSIVLETFGDERAGGHSVVLDLDACGRTKSRSWSDGPGETFTRDAWGRLAGWTRLGAGGIVLDRRAYRYEGDHLVEEESRRGVARRDVDEGGRVRALRYAAEPSVHYDYDGAGRRVARRSRGRARRYDYDVLGQLRRVVDDHDPPIEMAYDGLGRRLSVRRGSDVVFEHRDESGRLWAMTDEDGVALHTFVWVGDRLVARLDGPVGSPVSEGYLCDPLGTLLAVLHPGPGASAEFERVEALPFGRITSDARPTLYGHVGRRDLGLIHFGARDLDPELGLFLTPEPWHGGEDDPRRWAGVSDANLRRGREVPEAGVHDYALCQFDPVGRSDRDGHSSWVVHLIRWILLPTWGFPITSLSLFFFMPLNIYMEVVGLIIFIFKAICGDGRHPWGNHTIVKSTWLLGSARQFTFALGLNGFLPKVVTSQGIGNDRATTFGNVIWINSEELKRLNRPEVIDLWDIGGPPGGGAAPGPAGAAFFADTNLDKRSAVAVVGIDSDRKKQLHVSHWSRGFGNAVHDVGGQETFMDAPVPPAAGFATGTLLLRKPLPSDFPYPEDAGDTEKLEVHEYLHDGTGGPGANRSSRVETVLDAWFALKLPRNTAFAAGEWIQVEAPEAAPAEPPTYRKIADVVPAKDHAAALLRHELPTRFQTRSLKEQLRVQKVDVDASAATSEGWSTAGAPTKLECVLPVPPATPPAGWPPQLALRQPVRVLASAAVPSPVPPGHPPAEDTTFARIEALAVALKLSPPFGSVTAPTDLFLQRPEGSPFQGEVEDPAAPTKIKLSGPHPTIKKDDLLLVTRPGTSQTAYARAEDVTGEELTIDPALVPALTLAAHTNVRLQKYVDSNADKDKGTITSAAAEEVTVEAARSNLFPDGRLVRFESAGDRVLRRVESLRKVKVDLTDDAIGTPPFKVTKARLVEGRVTSGISLASPGRFLKLKVGDPPSAYGSYPGSILLIGSIALKNSSDVSAAYVQWSGTRPGDFHEGFRNSWKPAQVGGDSYWVLESPLPLLVRESFGSPGLFWRTDEESEEEHLQAPLGTPTAAILLQAREYSSSGVERVDTPGRRVTAHPPEVHVPIDPSVHDTHRRALIEHEIHHTVQCNFWGALMGAFPITGLIMLVSDMVEATGNEIPTWMDEVELDAHGNPPATGDGRIHLNTELNPFQVLSIGGLMQLLWKYVILGPALLSEDARKEITPLDFSDWNKIFNPVSRLLTEALPPVDPTAEPGKRWEAALGQLVERGLDLRSWTPLLGFLPFFVPSISSSWVEQQASRASGDLYSTILSANDRFNAELRMAPDLHDADIHPGLGDVVRLMMYAGYRTDRAFRAAHADRPGSALAYTTTFGENPLVEMRLPGTGTALFHPDLYEVQHSGGAPTRTVEAPAGHLNVDFMEAVGGDTIVPRLTSVVPSPPRVNRSAGFYFLPASHGTVQIDAGGTGESTQSATLTVEDEARLGDEVIPWALPPAIGTPPTTPPISTFHLTERQTLKMKEHGIASFVVALTQPAGPTGTPPPAGPFVVETPRTDGSGWDLQIGATLPPGPVRVRLYRVIKKNDAAFDLTYDDVPTLKGVRSFLPKDIWIPVRDFHLDVQDIPPAVNGSSFFDEAFVYDTVIPLVAEARAFAIVPPPGSSAPPVERKGSNPPRGERWGIGPLATPPEDDAVFRVTVTYGRAPHAVARPFELTFRPRIHLPKAGGGTGFEASKDHPLELDIVGGTAPYSADADGLPDGTSITVAGGKVVVTVTDAPAAAKSVVVVVRDSADKKGRRTIRVVP